MINEIEKKYDILLRLGSGGFAKVFKVRDKESKELYALKIIGFGEDDYSIDLDSQEYKDIIQEVEILKKFNSQNIVKVYDYLVLDGKLCILMEFVEGETLEEILKKEIVLETEHVLDITLQISVALMHCHDLQFIPSEIGYKTETTIIREKAIIHNDIHPKNIIRRVLPEGYQYVLIDFGLSFQNADTVHLKHTENGLAEYKSPEKWLRKPLFPSSDIYSLGILLFKCLGGSVPFPMTEQNNEEEIKKKHLYEPIPDLCDLRKVALLKIKGKESNDPDYPYWLQILVEKSLKKNPEERFYSGKILNTYYHDGKKGKLATEWLLKNPISKHDYTKAEERTGKEGPESQFFKKLQKIVNENSKIIRNLVLILVGIGLFSWFILSIWNEKDSNITQELNEEPIEDFPSKNEIEQLMSPKQIVEKYIQIEAAIRKKDDVEKLLPYLSFPLQYYDKTIENPENFLNSYEAILNKYEKREWFDISVNTTPNNKSSVIVNGKIKSYFYNSKMNYIVNASNIYESIVVTDSKIESFTKLKK